VGIKLGHMNNCSYVNTIACSAQQPLVTIADCADL
jgi:hypothetical protein